MSAPRPGSHAGGPGLGGLGTEAALRQRGPAFSIHAIMNG
jgi:hypothetical protein